MKKLFQVFQLDLRLQNKKKISKLSLDIGILRVVLVKIVGRNNWLHQLLNETDHMQHC